MTRQGISKIRRVTLGLARSLWAAQSDAGNRATNPTQRARDRVRAVAGCCRPRARVGSSDRKEERYVWDLRLRGYPTGGAAAGPGGSAQARVSRLRLLG